jgi:DNA-binding LytR/AlgR family response regulator
MKKLRCLIADDEPLMRERMTDLMAEHDDDFEIVSIATNGEEALTMFHAKPVDVCFLDIKMPVKSGLDVAAEISDRAKIVFCTAYDQFAITAFERGAVDYLLKPIEQERLTLTLNRLLGDVDTPPEDVGAVLHLIGNQTPSAQPPLKWIKALVGQDVKMFPVDDVIFFQSDTKYTRVVTEKEDVLIRTSLRDLLDGLNREVFWQVHRNAIVNVNRITTIKRDGIEKHSLLLRGHGERIAVSRHFAHLFKQM